MYRLVNWRDSKPPDLGLIAIQAWTGTCVPQINGSLLCMCVLLLSVVCVLMEGVMMASVGIEGKSVSCTVNHSPASVTLL